MKSAKARLKRRKIKARKLAHSSVIFVASLRRQRNLDLAKFEVLLPAHASEVLELVFSSSRSSGY